MTDPTVRVDIHGFWPRGYYPNNPLRMFVSPAQATEIKKIYGFLPKGIIAQERFPDDDDPDHPFEVFA